MKSYWASVSASSTPAKRTGPTMPATAATLIAVECSCAALRSLTGRVRLCHLPEQEEGQQADDREEEVGEGVAAEVGQRSAQGSADGVTGGPGEVGSAEGHRLFHPRLLGAAREERRAGHERGVEGPAGEDDEESQHPGVRDPRQREQDANGGQQARTHGAPVADAVGPT